MSQPGRFSLRNDPVTIVQEAELVPEPVRKVRKNSPQLGFDPRTLQPVVSRYKVYAFPARDIQ
jgi:hypothetical protein